MTSPSAFDDAGIRMLDSIREIFDILDIKFESVGFKLVEYKNFEELNKAINDDKCPIIDVLEKYLEFDPWCFEILEFDLYFSDKNGSHAMIATGIKNKNGIECIQLKNSYAENPNEQGKVHFFTLEFNDLS